MSHVPIVPGRVETSPRARKLGQRIALQIMEFQRQCPDTRPADVQQALRLAEGRAAARARQVIALIAGLLVAPGLATGLFVFGS